MIISTSVGVLVGGGIGMFIPSGSGSQMVLEFNRSETENKKAREKLYGLFSNTLDFRKIHVNIQGAHVYSRTKDQFGALNGMNGYDYYGEGMSDFNLLRKVQVTYSTQPDVEIGAAILWSSEPKIKQARYTSTYNYPANQNIYTSTYSNYEQTFQVKGYYLVGKYKPFLQQLPRSVDVAVTGGIGSAKIEYMRRADRSITQNSFNQSNTTSSVFQNDVNKSLISTFVSGEANYYLYDYFSIGVTADYSYYPSIDITGETTYGLQDLAISGNGSLGFVIGIHL
jgi:hypothetical protein